MKYHAEVPLPGGITMTREIEVDRIRVCGMGGGFFDLAVADWPDIAIVALRRPRSGADRGEVVFQSLLHLHREEDPE